MHERPHLDPPLNRRKDLTDHLVIDVVNSLRIVLAAAPSFRQGRAVDLQVSQAQQISPQIRR